jgi:hypothetical protein
MDHDVLPWAAATAAAAIVPAYPVLSHGFRDWLDDAQESRKVLPDLPRRFPVS